MSIRIPMHDAAAVGMIQRLLLPVMIPMTENTREAEMPRMKAYLSFLDLSASARMTIVMAAG